MTLGASSARPPSAVCRRSSALFPLASALREPPPYEPPHPRLLPEGPGPPRGLRRGRRGGQRDDRPRAVRRQGEALPAPGPDRDRGRRDVLLPARRPDAAV